MTPIRLRTIVLCLLIALLLFTAGCTCRDKQPPEEWGDWPGANVDGFVYGVSDKRLCTPAQIELLNALKKDIRSGLQPRRADLSEMVFIPAGAADLGCNVPREPRQECLPRQRREVAAFYIDRYEVSNRQYGQCVAELQCLPLPQNPHIDGYDEPDRPALIPFKQAERYCAWAGKRLPTEYEWEKAARGVDGRRYPWGDEAPTAQHANICGHDCTMQWARAEWDDGYRHTAPVEAFAAGDSPFGVRQMVGNVKEWVISSEPLPAWHFIARGASWYSDLPEMGASYRQIWRPGVRVDDKGVRCVVDEEMLRE